MTFPSTTLATAIAGKHLGFCGRLAAARRRAAARRPGVQRVFARIASPGSPDSRVYAPIFATTVLSAPRLQLTLAPSIHVDLHSTALVAPHVPARPFQVKKPVPLVTAPRPLQCATTVLRLGEVGPGRSRSDPVPPALAPLVRQVAERRYRAELSLVTCASASVRRSDVRRLEAIVRQHRAPAVAPKTDPTPAGTPHPEVRPTGRWAAPPQAMRAPAAIPDAEVARLTERVVQQINRRILAERERRGR